MKLMLMFLAALGILGAATAYAQDKARIPDALRGEWCRKAKCTRFGSMVVTPSKVMTWGESDGSDPVVCDIESVAQRASTTWELNLTCDGDGMDREKVRQIWSRSDARLRLGEGADATFLVRR